MKLGLNLHKHVYDVNGSTMSHVTDGKNRKEVIGKGDLQPVQFLSCDQTFYQFIYIRTEIIKVLRLLLPSD